MLATPLTMLACFLGVAILLHISSKAAICISPPCAEAPLDLSSAADFTPVPDKRERAAENQDEGCDSDDYSHFILPNEIVRVE